MGWAPRPHAWIPGPQGLAILGFPSPLG